MHVHDFFKLFIHLKENNSNIFGEWVVGGRREVDEREEAFFV